MRTRTLLSLTALLLGTLLLTACEEDVVAVVGAEEVFALYGVFTPQMDTQWVRVYPVEDRLEPAPARPLDARVTSTDMETGETRVWRDSILVDGDGQISHVFWSPFRAEYGHTYQFRAERSDGEASSVEVAVPPETSLAFGFQRNAWPVQIPIEVRGGAPRLIRVTFHYVLRVHLDATVTLHELEFPFLEDLQQSNNGDTWIIPFKLALAFEDISGRLELLGVIEEADDFDLEIREVTMRARVVNEEWRPPDWFNPDLQTAFDPDLLVQPGILENVENGFGFIGAGYVSELDWMPSPEALETAGFLYIPPPEEEGAGS